MGEDVIKFPSLQVQQSYKCGRTVPEGDNKRECIVRVA
jgi:hypothetical protein